MDIHGILKSEFSPKTYISLTYCSSHKRMTIGTKRIHIGNGSYDLEREVIKIKRWSLAVIQHTLVPANNTAESVHLVGSVPLFCSHKETT